MYRCTPCVFCSSVSFGRPDLTDPRPRETRACRIGGRAFPGIVRNLPVRLGKRARFIPILRAHFTSSDYAQIAMLCGKRDVAVSKQLLMASRIERVYRLRVAHFYLFCCSDKRMYGTGPLSASQKDFCAGSPFPRKRDHPFSTFWEPLTTARAAHFGHSQVILQKA